MAKWPKSVTGERTQNIYKEMIRIQTQYKMCTYAPIHGHLSAIHHVYNWQSHMYMQNNGTASDPATIANAFNNYFVNIGPTLASNIPDQGLEYRSYMPSGNEFSMFLTPVSAPEVKKNNWSFKRRLSLEGWCNFKEPQVYFWPYCSPIKPTSQLILFRGHIPNELKIAQVSPIYKAKDAMLFSNYRPISLLSIFSKILEKLMYDRLLDFLNKNRILNKYQFGFRNNHSTDMALVILLENLRNALDSGECAIGIFWISKKHLIRWIIVSYQISYVCMVFVVTTLEWFSSYLNNRYQYVVYNDCKSECRKGQY